MIILIIKNILCLFFRYSDNNNMFLGLSKWKKEELVLINKAPDALNLNMSQVPGQSSRIAVVLGDKNSKKEVAVGELDRLVFKKNPGKNETSSVFLFINANGATGIGYSDKCLGIDPDKLNEDHRTDEDDDDDSGVEIRLKMTSCNAENLVFFQTTSSNFDEHKLFHTEGNGDHKTGKELAIRVE